MLDSEGFDLWADGYDKSVGLSEEADEYPFAGYRDVLGGVYRAVRGACRPENGARVLDIGFGTGVLTKRLYDDGYCVWGVDFSARMCALARRKMPAARLFQSNFSRGLPPELAGLQFGCIVSTYALHHLTDAGKAELIEELLPRLSPGGLVLAGDVAFETAAQRGACRRASGGLWDADEHYPAFDEFRRLLPGAKLSFQKMSHCAGILACAR